MVGIHIDIEPTHLDHGNLHRPLLGLKPQNLPGAGAGNLTQPLEWNALHVRFLPLAVGVGRLNGHFECIPGRAAIHGLLQAGDDVVRPVQVRHGVALAR